MTPTQYNVFTFFLVIYLRYLSDIISANESVSKVNALMKIP